MSFPIVFQFGPFAIPAHLVFESLAYAVGFRVFLLLRRRWGDDIPEETRWTVIAGAAVGAVIGSKLLGWIQHPAEAWAHRLDAAWLLGGKTIVGGLLGGLVGVELAKLGVGERRSTGDLMALPLCIGMALGRVGCFLAGLPDHTYGVATALPWGIDFGDGIRRHPTQLYEIAVLGLIAVWLVTARPRIIAGNLMRGDLFRGFMVAYLTFRIVAEQIKPEPRPYLGLTAIEIACALGLLYYARHIPRLFLRTARADRG